MTRTSMPAPASLDVPARAVPTVLRAQVVRAGSAITRALISGGRYWRTALAAIRLGLMWSTFCANTGLAIRRISTDEHGGMHVRIHAVPRLSRVRLTPHGWTVRVRLTPGQHRDQYGELAVALRHAARAQTVKPVELPDRPGYLELRILRRDPLVRVTEQPRELRAGRLATGSTETGEPMVLDFDAHPHYLLCGATGSGKSMLLSCIQAAIAPTDAALVFWDLKFGIEAEPWRTRYTEVCTTQQDVLASVGRVLWLAEQRATMLRELGCRNASEADALGVHLRRLYVLVDEVAELAHDHDADKTADKVLRELLRAVQLVRAMGIHIILCGQRFGSDLGKNITSIRAQVSGRICLGVNDAQTAEMVLSGLPPDVQKRALTLTRPGLAIVQDGLDWHYARSSYLSTTEIRALATAHAERRVDWADLMLTDRASFDQRAAARQ